MSPWSFLILVITERVLNAKVGEFPLVGRSY